MAQKGKKRVGGREEGRGRSRRSRRRLSRFDRMQTGQLEERLGEREVERVQKMLPKQKTKM